MRAWEEFEVIIQDFEFYTDSIFVTKRRLVLFQESSITLIFSLSKNPEEKYIKWFIKRIESLEYLVDDSNFLVCLIKKGESFSEVDTKFIRFSFYISHQFNLVDFVLKNPDENELLKTLSKDVLILQLFTKYCNDGIRDYDKLKEILEPISADSPTFLPVIRKRDVRLPHNLSDQFVIDITPIFLKKLYKATNLIFRVSLYNFEERRVTSTDRWSPKSISSETDETLKELGLKLTWRDIFIFEN